MIREDGSKPHRPCVQDSLVAEATKTGMAMDNLDLLSYNDISEDREEGEDGRERGGTVHDEEGDMIDLEAVGKVADTGSPFVRVRDNDDLVSAINELCGELVDVTFDTSRLREEVVADESDIVRHVGGCKSGLSGPSVDIS